MMHSLSRFLFRSSQPVVILQHAVILQKRGPANSQGVARNETPTSPALDQVRVCQSMFKWIKQTYPDLTADDLKNLWEQTPVNTEVEPTAEFLNLITKASNERKR